MVFWSYTQTMYKHTTHRHIHKNRSMCRFLKLSAQLCLTCKIEMFQRFSYLTLLCYKCPFSYGRWLTNTVTVTIPLEYPLPMSQFQKSSSQKAPCVVFRRFAQGKWCVNKDHVCRFIPTTLTFFHWLRWLLTTFHDCLMHQQLNINLKKFSPGTSSVQ